jgi:hypothetical protein
MVRKFQCDQLQWRNQGIDCGAGAQAKWQRHHRNCGPNEDEQFPIQKGKIDGDKITLEANDKGQTMTFNLVLASGRITGEAQMSREGQTRKAKIDVGRAK